MAITPERRREINRENARHSTGPKTPEGKARSRQNARKHGLRAESIALPHEDAEALADLTDEWLDYYRPDSPGRRALLDRAVLATVQLGRCARFQAAAVSKQVRAAEEHWDEEQEDRLAALRKLLPTDPAGAARELRRSAPGCRWLIGRWEELGARLDEEGRWSIDSERDEALRLLGHAPDDLGDPDVYWLRFLNVSADESPDEAALKWYLAPARVPDIFRETLAEAVAWDRGESREYLRDQVVDQLEGLRVREARLRRNIEGPDRAEAAERAQLLDGPEAERWMRYERMHDAAFHRAYRALLKPSDQTAEGEPEGVHFGADLAGSELPSIPPPGGGKSELFDTLEGEGVTQEGQEPAPISEPLSPWSGEDRPAAVLDITATPAAPNEPSSIPAFDPGEGVPAELDERYAALERGILAALKRKNQVSTLVFEMTPAEPPPPPVS